MKKYFAEFFGTFWLIFGGCGSAVLATAYPELGIGFAGIALAFGLTVLTMAYAVGHISGGRFNGKDLLPYIISQVIGAIAAAGVLYLIASGKTGFDAVASGFASNGFGEHSPNGYDMMAALLIEFVLTAFFLIIMGSTDKLTPAGFAPIAICLGLTLIHLISIPVTNTSVNPARSTGVALFQGGWAVEQLWLFWLAPIAGAAIGAAIYRFVLANNDK